MQIGHDNTGNRERIRVCTKIFRSDRKARKLAICRKSISLPVKGGKWVSLYENELVTLSHIRRTSQPKEDHPQLS